MDCRALFEHLTDFLEGNLDAEQEAMALEHLSRCPNCERTLDQTRRVTMLVADHGRMAFDDDRRREALRRILRSLG